MGQSAYNFNAMTQASKLLFNAKNLLGSCGQTEHAKMDMIMKKIGQCVRDLDEIADKEEREMNYWMNYWNCTSLNERGFERCTYEFYYGCVIVKYRDTYSVYRGSSLIVETDLHDHARYMATVATVSIAN